MLIKRKYFLKLTGALSAGMLAGTSTGSNFLTSIMQDEDSKKIKKFGLQLWTMRDELPKDPKGILKQIASFGYSNIESFEGQQGMFWGMKNTEFKKYISDLGLTMHSSHYGNDKDFEKKVADAAEIGMKYLILAWEGPGKTIDDYKRYAEDFNKKGELCKKNGLRFAFHNHDFTFKKLEGQYAQDVLLNNTEASLVDFEMDIYWVVTAGQDPEAWFKKYPNRFRLCHVKDRIKESTEDNASCTLGTGSLNFPKILKTAKENGMHYYIVEQERYDGTTPLNAIKDDAEYLKKFRF